METNIKILPQLTFSDALRMNYINFADIKGRSRRSELWWNYLAYAFVSVCVTMFIPGLDLIVKTVVSFLLQLWMVPVTIRRMHDNNHSGIWVAAAVAIGVTLNVYGFATGMVDLENTDPAAIIEMVKAPAFVGLSLASSVVNLTILVFAVMDGSKEDNKYGPSPKYVNPIAD